jgi:primosomal protein N' (replication factor Y) (superfamily II helicase)
MKKDQFADIVLPLAVKGRFTYRVPTKLEGTIRQGSMVIVQFGNRKLYSGIVNDLHYETPELETVKSVLDVLDLTPVINETQLKFWRWISEYYMCTIGEVMKAALPSGLCLESETQLKINPEFNDFKSLDNSSSLVFSIIENRGSALLKSLPGIVKNRNILKVINELVIKQAFIAGESILEKYKPRESPFIILSKKLTDKELNDILDSLIRAPQQQNVLSTFIRITGYKTGADLFPVKKSILLKQSGAFPSSINSLERKGILVSVNLEVSRLTDSEGKQEPLRELSMKQSEAYVKIKQQMNGKEIILLHGITSSGKTEIYIHLIEEHLKQGKQVLYLLPEIALTTQIIERLRKHFGSLTGVYHSRFNDAEKVEIWKKVADNKSGKGYQLILGVRSALFLPFNNLGLVIVDEEHDGSYKQHDPSPRYHARDSAIMLAGLAGAKTVLGSATPSIESYHNAVLGKYGFATLSERFGKINLPEIVVANTREAYRKKLMVSHFTPELLRAIDEALVKNEQVILFRNRRGFSPYIECSECGWIPSCTQCAVNLTYHKEINRLVCHYCGSATVIPIKCGNCGSISMVTRGFGTEKIEEEIKIIFPKARIARMDQDTTRKKNSFNKIIRAFEEKQTDILIGTQMISKGLDFENLTVVGILNAESILNYPDFRAHEKGFQLMTQVSGRAGRRQKHGKVIIQTSDPENHIIRLVLKHDYPGMYNYQSEERKLFNYPPFCRLISIVIKHKDRSKLNEFAALLGNDLKSKFGGRVLGPEFPLIQRIQLWYIKNILIKIEKDKPLAKAKHLINEAIEKLEKVKGTSSLKISVDVDPY